MSNTERRQGGIYPQALEKKTCEVHFFGGELSLKLSL